MWGLDGGDIPDSINQAILNQPKHQSSIQSNQAGTVAKHASGAKLFFTSWV
jgi:hypothetical protein